MRMLPLFLLALVLAFASCKPRTSTTEGGSGTQDSSTSALPLPDTSCKAITQATDGRMDGIMSATAVVDGDCLHMKIIHGGGCKTHDFQLLWNGAHMESMPPQVDLILSHNSNEDHCRSILNVKKSFDLRPLRYAGIGQVILNIRLPDQEGSSIRANYTYQP